MEVTDRIGSGDALWAAFWPGFCPGLLRKTGVSGKMAITRRMDLGNACASLKMTRRGDALCAAGTEIEEIVQRRYDENVYEMKR